MPHIHPLIRSTFEMPSPCSRIRCRVRERFGDATRRLHANTVSVTLYQYLHYVRKYSTNLECPSHDECPNSPFGEEAQWKFVVQSGNVDTLGGGRSWDGILPT